jgi:hypothetical protein
LRAAERADHKRTGLERGMQTPIWRKEYEASVMGLLRRFSNT